MSDFRPIVAFVVTLHYDVILYTLPAAAIVAGLILIIFYNRKTIPEMVAIYFGLFLLIGGVSLTALHYLFHLNVGRVEVVKYTGEGPSGE